MKIDECMKIKHKKNNNNTNEIIANKKIKYLKNLLTRILLSIILILSISIFIKINDKNLLLVNDNLFESSLEFTKINNLYQKYFGKVIPNINNSPSTMVFNSDDLKKNKYENNLDGVKISLDKGSPISLINGGIVVYIGEKEDYGNTLILQGNDGIDYWYGGITNINVNLYDYLEKNTLIGETSDDYLNLVLQKDGKYLNYEEYIQ